MERLKFTGILAALGIAAIAVGAGPARTQEPARIDPAVHGPAAAPPSPPVEAAPVTPPAAGEDEIVVRGRGDSLVGISAAASSGTVGAVQLEQRPIARPGEVLETVPGVIVTQHSGGGKANQFFLRGFNLDHGTDFATSLDGVPINLPSHGHGQGWTDLNFVIPELIERVNYDKGVYYANRGDFSSVGAANLEYCRALPRNLASLETGMFGFARGVLAGSAPLAGGQLLAALELFHNDGPWAEPEGYHKHNAVLRYSGGDAEAGWSVSGSLYGGRWHSTDQIALRAERRPGFGRFDSLSDSDGGQSSKSMLYGEWHRRDERSASELVLYGFRQRLNLLSDVTYFLRSPDGDQVLQRDQRWVGGAQAKRTWFGQWGGRETETSVGLQLRGDRVRNGLFQTVRGQRRDKRTYPQGDPNTPAGVIPSATRRDRIWEASVSPYLESRVRWAEKVRTVLGARADLFHFDTDGVLADESGALEPVSGRKNAVRVSPKASLIFGPWSSAELYLSGGFGFHSNDARGVPSRTRPADPLVRTYGGEVGVRTTAVDGLQSSLALWWLDADSELLFVGDAGTTEASRPSRRYGVELANYYTAREWLTLDFDVSLSRARFRDDAPEGRDIPGSVEAVVAMGVSLHDLGGWFGELRLRYFGPRALLEDDSVRSHETLLMSARIGYELSPHWTISAELFNLLGRRDNEIDYFYSSRLSPDETPAPNDADGGVPDVHFHPTDPLSFRIGVNACF